MGARFTDDEELERELLRRRRRLGTRLHGGWWVPMIPGYTTAQQLPPPEAPLNEDQFEGEAPAGEGGGDSA